MKHCVGFETKCMMMVIPDVKTVAISGRIISNGRACAPSVGDHCLQPNRPPEFQIELPVVSFHQIGQREGGDHGRRRDIVL